MAALRQLLHIPELRRLVFAYQHGHIGALLLPMSFLGSVHSVLSCWRLETSHPVAWAQAFVAHLDLHENYIETYASVHPELFTQLVMDHQASSGRLERLKQLATFGIHCTKRSVKLAAERGHLEVLEYLHETYLREAEWSVHAMDRAAARGHLEVVQFLHENRSEGCTSSAMDLAALGGHKEIVEFLHKMRTEGCTTNAMRNAAKEGHLNIVQFLHHNRHEGCTREALNMAAAAGHTQVVQWLVENRQEGVLADALEYAARHGHVDVVAYLHQQQLKRWQRRCERAVQTAAENGHLSVVKYFFDTQRGDLPPWSWCSVYMQALVTPRRTNGVVMGLF